MMWPSSGYTSDDGLFLPGCILIGYGQEGIACHPLLQETGYVELAVFKVGLCLLDHYRIAPAGMN